MLTVHHLGLSQSERIHWLCEELGVPYELKRYDRDPSTRLAHPIFKQLHPMGAAPIITDGAVTLAESGAIMDCILAKHGNGRLVVGPAAPNFADYLYWYHFANGTFMPRLANAMMVSFAAGSNDHPMAQSTKARETAAFEMIERRLGEVPYLAGSEFTAADIMNFFPLTTLRTFRSEAPAARPNTRAYVKRVSERPAYRRAMAAGDPGLPLTFG